MKSKKIATYGLLVALAFILSYVETLIPLPVPIPGMKLGLANLVVITAIYSMGYKEAFVLSIIRIVLVGFTFGNLSTMIYSLAGGLLSYTMMVLSKKSKLFSIVGVSIIGGVSHNIGQIIVAILVINNMNLAYYLPFLLITGAVTGTLIGILGSMIVKRLNKIV
ncbi:MAG TPA: Gx transporter family protein [Mobilitalea sp.]|nr:Gx transporter family protein [Mobilitalea sp.]